MGKLLALVALLLSLGGCVARPPEPQVRFVTGIHVCAVRDGHTVQKSSSDPETMSIFLNYLRLLDPYTTADIQEETFRADICEIRVEYSDGQSTLYRQLHDQFLQTDGGPWKKIDPAYGARLSNIISDFLG